MESKKTLENACDYFIANHMADTFTMNILNKFIGLETDELNDTTYFSSHLLINGIGQMFRDGVGTKADETQAQAYFERSAKLGNADAGNPSPYPASGIVP